MFRMGKSWKGRSHLNTGYPYNHIRVANLQSFGEKRDQLDGDIVTGMYGKAGHPVFSNVNMGAPHDDMKHLEFLRAYGNYYCNKVAYAYTSSCSLLPSSCRSGLRNLETKVTTMSAPFLNGLQQSSERVLWNLDSKVDSIVRVAQKAMQPKALSHGSDEASLELTEASEARKAYLQQVVESLRYLREHGIATTAREAMGSLMTRTNEDQHSPLERETDAQPMVRGVQDAWVRLSESPQVTRLIETAQPSIDYTQQKYVDAHKVVVASDTYNRAIEAAAEVLIRMQGSPLYRAAVVRLYPMVSGVADPAIERIANSAYTKAVVEHLKPIQRSKEDCATEEPVTGLLAC